MVGCKERNGGAVLSCLEIPKDAYVLDDIFVAGIT